MEESSLPVILSLPHGGLTVPNELAGRLGLSEQDVFNECDLWIDDLFDLEKADSGSSLPSIPLAKVSTPIARALIDANRDPSDISNPDGPIKAQSSYGQCTYAHPLSEDEKRRLVQDYWQPFHSALADAFTTCGRDAKLFLDCHSMAQTGPSAYLDSGRARPLICLANLGTATGDERAARGRRSCTAAFIREAAAVAEEVFGELALLEPLPGPPPPVVAINQPYPGGYILRVYAADRDQNELPPGMMIEINRGLYVGNQDAGWNVGPPNAESIAAVRACILEWLLRVVDLF